MGMGIAVEQGQGKDGGITSSEREKANEYYSSSKDKGVRPAVRARAAAKPLALGACVIGGLLTLMALSGFMQGGNNKAGSSHRQSSHYTKTGVPPGPRRYLRGTMGVVLLAGKGSRIEKGKVDHHHARVLLVPSLEPFSRRNVHHYRTHDAQGKLAPLGGHRTDEGKRVHVDWAEVRREGLWRREIGGRKGDMGVVWLVCFCLPVCLPACVLHTHTHTYIPQSIHMHHQTKRTSSTSAASTCGTRPTCCSAGTTTSCPATPGAYTYVDM